MAGIQPNSAQANITVGQLGSEFESLCARIKLAQALFAPQVPNVSGLSSDDLTALRSGLNTLGGHVDTYLADGNRVFVTNLIGFGF